MITRGLHLVIARVNPLTHWLSSPAFRVVTLGLHAVLLLGLYLHHGILADKEALKYIGCAEQVLHGDFHDLFGNYVKYASYVVFLLPFLAIGAPELAIVAQIILGIAAAFALSRLAERTTKDPRTGSMTMVLFLLSPLIQTWALALYTEYFFTCLSVLFMERAARIPYRDPILVFLGAVTLFARPVGIFFVVPVLLWRLMDTWSPRMRSAVVLLGSAAVIVVVIAVPKVEHAQLLPIAQGQVIAGVGGVQNNVFQEHTIADAQRSLLGQVGITAWCKITFQRMVALITLTRPHYSAFHNAINTGWMLLYPLALLGAWRARREPLVQLLVSILIPYVVFIGLTHAEWSGRFMVPLLPWVFVLATVGTSRSKKLNGAVAPTFGPE